MIRTSVLAAALFAVGQSAFAQPLVGGASQIQQIPPAPAPPKSIPEIRVERGQAAVGPTAPGARFVVRSLHVTGETRFTAAELVAAAQFRPGAELDLAGLRAMAARISAFYNSHGYFVAQAYLPAQSIEDGAVTIAVIEGRYGSITLENRSKVSDGVARGILSGLEPGDPVATASLERRLLLLSDLPGVRVGSTLSPGTEVGASDLLVNLTPGRGVSGSIEADNAGNRYTGAYRAGGTVNFNEPTGHGDVASLRYLTSGSGLNYGRAAYQAQVQDGTVGVAYARLGYRLGREFAPLHASGTVGIASLYGSYPVIRSRRTNLRALLEFDADRFRDKVAATRSVTDRSAHVVIVGLAGDHRWRSGSTTYSVNWGFGDLNIDTPLVRAADALTARTAGGYNKLSFDLAHLQELGGPLSIYGEVRGQIASKNLDSAEKMELGGAYGVRAYPEGEAYGDQGYLVTAEARLRVASISEHNGGQLQAVAFIDAGSVTLNKTPWAAGSNHRTLSAAGVGLNWADSQGFLVKVSYAFKLTDDRAVAAPDRSGRVWVHVAKLF